jgi:Protein of unknown function (DUF4079)
MMYMDEAPLSRALAFVHPAWMLMSLALAIATARLGLIMRRRRLAGQPAGADLRRRHLRFGKTSLVAIAIGFVIGPVSMVLIRERPAFDSFHSVLGLIVAGLFLWTGWSGRALSRGRQDARDIHRIAAASSLAAAAVSAVAGFILLP